MFCDFVVVVVVVVVVVIVVTNSPLLCCPKMTKNYAMLSLWYNYLISTFNEFTVWEKNDSELNNLNADVMQNMEFGMAYKL